jgi:hypothetical protein
MSELTAEMVAAYQQQQAEAEQQRRHQLINSLITMAAEQGYEIVALPQIVEDGRLGAVWGVRPK